MISLHTLTHALTLSMRPMCIASRDFVPFFTLCPLVFAVDTVAERINELEDTVTDLMKRAGVTPEEVARLQEERRRARQAADPAAGPAPQP